MDYFFYLGPFFLTFFVANLAFINVLCPDSKGTCTLALSSLALAILPVHFLMFYKQGHSNLLQFKARQIYQPTKKLTLRRLSLKT